MSPPGCLYVDFWVFRVVHDLQPELTVDLGTVGGVRLGEGCGEVNPSTSGVLKNAIAFLYEEWTNKAAALVSYGSAGGARAIEHLRGVLSELRVAHVQQSLSFSAFTDFDNFRSREAKLIGSGPGLRM